MPSILEGSLSVDCWLNGGKVYVRKSNFLAMSRQFYLNQTFLSNYDLTVLLEDTTILTGLVLFVHKQGSVLYVPA